MNGLSLIVAVIQESIRMIERLLPLINKSSTIDLAELIQDIERIFAEVRLDEIKEEFILSQGLQKSETANNEKG